MSENLENKENEEVETRCNGKVLIVDFSKLKEEDFPHVSFRNLNFQDQWGLPARNGQLYINRNILDAIEFLLPILEVLMNDSYAALNRFERANRKKYRGLSFDSLTEFIESHDDKSIARAVYYLLIPMERTRRFIERNYYGNKK